MANNTGGGSSDFYILPKNKPYLDIPYLYKEINSQIIIKNDYKYVNSQKNYYINSQNIYSTLFPYMQAASPVPSINWGGAIRPSEPVAYIPLTSQEIQKVIEAIHRVEKLSDSEREQFIEATRELRYFFDGAIRARFGATQHYNAIRCLNHPQQTELASALRMRDVQLAGEEYFGVNRFMPNFADVADIQWWAVYEGGSWGLDTFNPEGEHLDTGVNGWGSLVGSVIKVDGRVLAPAEMIAFYRSVRLRNERGFVSEGAKQTIETILRLIDAGVALPRRYESQLETVHDLGLVDVAGKALTYVGKSMITPVTARARKERQVSEIDSQVRRIIVPTSFN